MIYIRKERAEIALVSADTADRHASEPNAVVALGASDELGASGLAPGPMIAAGDLQSRVDGFGPGIGEEDVSQVTGSQRGQSRGELESRRMAHLEGGDVVELLRLRFDRRHNRRLRMPGVDTPQPCYTVEDLATVGCPVVHAASAGEQARTLLEGAVRGEGHPERSEGIRGGRGCMTHVASRADIVFYSIKKQ